MSAISNKIYTVIRLILCEIFIICAILTGFWSYCRPWPQWRRAIANKIQGILGHYLNVKFLEIVLATFLMKNALNSPSLIVNLYQIWSKNFQYQRFCSQIKTAQYFIIIIFINLFWMLSSNSQTVYEYL